MSDRELLEEYVRVQRDADQTRIMVREIHWDGPHTPVSTWGDWAGAFSDCDRSRGQRCIRKRSR
jgi:hypothetical protein